MQRSIKSTPNSPQNIFRELTGALVAHQTALAERLRLTLTEFKCLGVLHRRGAIVPRDLAQEMLLTPAAVTGVVNRLVALGFARKEANPGDGRSFVVYPIAERTREVARLYAPMAKHASRLNREFSPTQLRVINNYLKRAVEILRAEAVRVKADG